MNISSNDIEALVALFEHSKWKELNLQIGGSKIYLGREASCGASWGKPRAASPTIAVASGKALAADGSKTLPAAPSPVPASLMATESVTKVTVDSPSLGTFRRAGASGGGLLVEAGQRIKPDTELCRLDVLGESRFVSAGVTGTIREILAKDGDLIEFGQSLFVIDTEA